MITTTCLIFRMPGLAEGGRVGHGAADAGAPTVAERARARAATATAAARRRPRRPGRATARGPITAEEPGPPRSLQAARFGGRLPKPSGTALPLAFPPTRPPPRSSQGYGRPHARGGVASASPAAVPLHARAGSSAPLALRDRRSGGWPAGVPRRPGSASAREAAAPRVPAMGPCIVGIRIRRGLALMGRRVAARATAAHRSRCDG
jgi:hypothetical protein